jgi:ribosomal-protein-alanine N-acetyltransferase
MSEQFKDLTIERMREDDLAEVLRIEKESFSDPWTRECFLEDLYKDFTCPAVAKIAEKLVGYICVWKIVDELQIANLAVDSLYRKRGIAHQLLQWVIEYALNKNCRTITLDVRVSNLVASEFYRKFGFEEVGRRKNYYRYPVEDAIIMGKKL